MKLSPLVLSALAVATLVLPRRALADEPPSEPLPLLPQPSPSPPPPPFVTPPPPAPRLARKVPTVQVHLDVKRPVTLEILSPDETRWRPLCAAPCDADVPLEGVYRVVDHGMLSSSAIELDARPGDRVVLDVTVRTAEQHQTGRRLVLASYIAGAVGLGLEIGALAVDSTSDAQPALLWSGIGAAAVAIGCTIGSFVLLEPTSLSQSSATPSAGPVARATSPWTRAPVWERTDVARWAGPPPPALSVFSTRF